MVVPWYEGLLFDLPAQRGGPDLDRPETEHAWTVVDVSREMQNPEGQMNLSVTRFALAKRSRSKDTGR
jgi:hypothetical protein